MSHSVDYSTLTTPSSTLIPSRERSPEDLRTAQLNAADYVKSLGLPESEEEAALREILQVLGLIPTPYAE